MGKCPGKGLKIKQLGSKLGLPSSPHPTTYWSLMLNAEPAPPMPSHHCPLREVLLAPPCTPGN